MKPSVLRIGVFMSGGHSEALVPPDGVIWAVRVQIRAVLPPQAMILLAASTDISVK